MPCSLDSECISDLCQTPLKKQRLEPPLQFQCGGSLDDICATSTPVSCEEMYVNCQVRRQMHCQRQQKEVQRECPQRPRPVDYPSTCGGGPCSPTNPGLPGGQSVPQPVDILGCMDITADNYNPKATKDDGSCTTVVVSGSVTVQQPVPPNPVVSGNRCWRDGEINRTVCPPRPAPVIPPAPGPDLSALCHWDQDLNQLQCPEGVQVPGVGGSGSVPLMKICGGITDAMQELLSEEFGFEITSIDEVISIDEKEQILMDITGALSSSSFTGPSAYALALIEFGRGNFERALETGLLTIPGFGTILNLALKWSGIDTGLDETPPDMKADIIEGVLYACSIAGAIPTPFSPFVNISVVMIQLGNKCWDAALYGLISVVGGTLAGKVVPYIKEFLKTKPQIP